MRKSSTFRQLRQTVVSFQQRILKQIIKSLVYVQAKRHTCDGFLTQCFLMATGGGIRVFLLEAKVLIQNGKNMYVTVSNMPLSQKHSDINKDKCIVGIQVKMMSSDKHRIIYFKALHLYPNHVEQNWLKIILQTKQTQKTSRKANQCQSLIKLFNLVS